MAQSLPSTEWMEFHGTAGFNLPATSVEFKVPIVTTPTDAPTLNQIGYTIAGTTAAVTPFKLDPTGATGVTARSLTIPQGTWLLSANVNTYAVNDTIDIQKWSAGFVSAAGNHVVDFSTAAGLDLPALSYYGHFLTCIYQVAANTVVDLDVIATFTPPNPLTDFLEINNVDDVYVHMTATRLS